MDTMRWRVDSVSGGDRRGDDGEDFRGDASGGVRRGLRLR